MIPPRDLLVSRSDGVQAHRRGDRVLLIEPESASWFVVEPHMWPIYARTERPLTFGDLCAALPEEPPGALGAAVEKLHAAGMLRLNGRPYHDVIGLFDSARRQGPQFLALHLVQGCNFRCSYCYNSSEMFQGKVMPASVARRILEKAFSEIPAPSLMFDFLGGEPLLAFERVVEVVRHGRELAQKHGRSVSFALQTNGSMLTLERARVLKEHGVGVGVSLDGPEDLHDRHRVAGGGQGTHRQVLANLLRARDVGLRVSPLAVIHDPESYTRVLDYFVDLEFTGMRLNYSNLMGRARDRLSFAPERALSYHAHFMSMVDRAVEHARRLGRPLLILDLNSMIRNLTSKLRDFMCMRSPCGMGDAILSFSVDGQVYACEEYEESTRGRFLLGPLEDLHLGRPAEVSEKLRHLKTRRVESIPKCSRCALRHFCGGGCAHKALAFHGELLREDPMCRFYELTYQELMWRIWADPALPALLGGVADGGG